MNKDLTVYIPTCDANVFVLKYFQYFLNKYWGNQVRVKILGFTPPRFKLNDNFEFISLDSEQKRGAKGWSNYLIDYFKSIKDEFFVLGIDDFMIVREVNLRSLEACCSLIHQDDHVGRVDLQPSLVKGREPRFLSPYKPVNGVEFIKLSQLGPYQNAGAFSIWRREWFLKNIKHNWSPWDWEIKGSILAMNDGFWVVGAEKLWPIKKIELLSSQWPRFINSTGIRHNDLEVMRKMVEPTDGAQIFKDIHEPWFGLNSAHGWLYKNNDPNVIDYD